jgi:hypothetical protein
MRDREGIIQVVCADSGLTRLYLAELQRSGKPYQLPLALSPANARRSFCQSEPAVTLLDESAVPAEESLESAAAQLAETAPVVVVAAPERQGELAFLIASGAADFVPRVGWFVSLAANSVERRVDLAAVSADVRALPDGGSAGDFGELLRHEVNNPLTGILGNAELLLAGRDRLAPGSVERLQTIAKLAVRLRETVRRLSYAFANPDAASASSPEPTSPEVTTRWRNSDAHRSTRSPAPAQSMPPPRSEPAAHSHETERDAAVARLDKTSRSRTE